MAVNAAPTDPLNPTMTATRPQGIENERLAEIKLQVLNGTYLTEERIDAACEALFGTLSQPDRPQNDPQQPNSDKQLCGC